MDPALMSKAWVAVLGDDLALRHSALDLLGAFGLDAQEFETQDAFFARLEAREPDAPACLIVDLASPPKAGFDVHRRLVERSSSVAVVVVVAQAGDVPRIVGALRNGAVTVLERPAREEELWSAVQEGIARSDEQLRRRRHHRTLETRLRSLTPQDRQVLQLLMEGSKNRIIAKRLDVSLRTVENRRRRIFDCMDADSVAELARLVVEYENELLPAPPSTGSWLLLPFERVA